MDVRVAVRGYLQTQQYGQDRLADCRGVRRDRFITAPQIFRCPGVPDQASITGRPSKDPRRWPLVQALCNWKLQTMGKYTRGPDLQSPSRTFTRPVPSF